MPDANTLRQDCYARTQTPERRRFSLAASLFSARQGRSHLSMGQTLSIACGDRGRPTHQKSCDQRCNNPSLSQPVSQKNQLLKSADRFHSVAETVLRV
jgi:hypothetical protein